MEKGLQRAKCGSEHRVGCSFLVGGGQYMSREVACARTDAKMLGQSGELFHLAACCVLQSAGKDSAEGMGRG